MAETTMPATEVGVVEAEREQNSYELAFHILPTVAEEEVQKVFEELKTSVTKAGGEVFSEEAPERIELAYEIVKQSDGKNKKYASAYFSWFRFRIEPEKIEKFTESVETNQSVLRHLLIKLTKVEEANPFRFHEHRKTQKKVEIFDDEENDILSDPLLASDEDLGVKNKQEESKESEGTSVEKHK